MQDAYQLKAAVDCRAGRGATVSLTLIQRSAMETVQIAAIVVRTEKISVSCRFASVPFDNIAVTAKHQPRRMDMRFISILTHNPGNRLPTEAEMASMHKFIAEGMKAG